MFFGWRYQILNLPVGRTLSSTLVDLFVLSSENTKALHICYQIQRKTGAESIQQIWKENLSTNWKLFFSWKTGLEKNLAKNCLVLIPGWERYEGAFSPVPEKYGWANGNYFEAQRGRWVLLFYLKLSPVSSINICQIPLVGPYLVRNWTNGSLGQILCQCKLSPGPTYNTGKCVHDQIWKICYTYVLNICFSPTFQETLQALGWKYYFYGCLNTRS